MPENNKGAYKPRMKAIYEDRIVKAMQDKFGYANALEIPRIEKIVLNMGVGDATQDRKRVDQAVAEMELIAGRLAVVDVIGLPIVRTWYAVHLAERRLMPGTQALCAFLTVEGGRFLPVLPHGAARFADGDAAGAM